MTNAKLHSMEIASRELAAALGGYALASTTAVCLRAGLALGAV